MKPKEYIKEKITHYRDLADALAGSPDRWADRKLALRLVRENQEILRRLHAEEGIR